MGNKLNLLEMNVISLTKKNISRSKRSKLFLFTIDMIKRFSYGEVKPSNSKVKRFEVAHVYNSHSFIIIARMEGNLVVSDRELIIF